MRLFASFRAIPLTTAEKNDDCDGRHWPHNISDGDYEWETNNLQHRSWYCHREAKSDRGALRPVRFQLITFIMYYLSCSVRFQGAKSQSAPSIHS